ncbi:MAG TPA: hypothetical protein VF815_26205, partial [Myxococcaceae bacterium]
PDPLINGGFEAGALSGWTSTGTVTQSPGAHSGSAAAVLGSPTLATFGDSTLRQTFTVPAAGALLRYWFLSNAVDVPADYAAVRITDHATGLTTALSDPLPAGAGWQRLAHDLTGYAGHSVTLTFVNHEEGTGGATSTAFDDVSLLVPGDFSLSLSPASQSVQVGATATYTVNTQGQGTLLLAVSGVPAGATATFSPATVTAGQPSTLSVSTTSSVATSTFPLTVTATESSSQASRSASAQLNVTPVPGAGGSFSYSATNTASATQNTTNRSVVLNAGQTLQVGTCTVPGASGTGDTYLRLYGVNGSQVTSNDDSCGTLSFLSYKATQGGTYEIRAGCYSTGSCSGTVAYTVQ